MRLLIVEDNRELASLIAGKLQGSGFAIDMAGTVGAAEALIEAAHYAAVILDLGLPDRDGMDLVQALRHRGNAVPILILTARSAIDDRITGLNAGADDYLVKPFSHEELIARIQALLRRPGAILGRRLQVGNMVFDSETREALIGDQRLDLSQREREVLELLMRRQGKIVTKRLIEDQLFGFDDLGSNAVEVYVHRLRKRFEHHGARARIHTVRGVGYVLEELSA